MMRQAISPRLAIRIFLNIALWTKSPATPPTASRLGLRDAEKRRPRRQQHRAILQEQIGIDAVRLAVRRAFCLRRPLHQGGRADERVVADRDPRALVVG